MRRPAVLRFLVPTLLVALSVGAVIAAQRLQGSLEDYASPYAASSEPGEQPTLGAPPLSRLTPGRVVVVVIDGLRIDTSMRMTVLNSLRGRGAWTVMRGAEPSYSKPGYAVLASGAWPEVTGVLLNGHRGRLGVDTLFARVKRAGLTTAVIADEWWGELVGPVVDYPYLYPDGAVYSPATDAKALADTIKSLEVDRADLTLAHFCWVDTEGHAAGGANDRRYLAAAQRVDGFLSQILARLDPAVDTLIVTSDHGHLVRNNRGGSGHGGWEDEVLNAPLVMFGKSIREGELKPARSVDVAPTVTALLGVPAPLESQGQILWEGLWATDAARAAGEIALARQTARFMPAYVRGLTAKVGRGIAGEISRGRKAIETAAARYAEGRYQEAERQATLTRQGLLERAAKLRNLNVWTGRLMRLPVGLIVAAVAALGLAVGGRRRSAPALVGGVLFLALDVVLYRYAFADPFSLGALPDSGVITFLRLFGLPAYLAALAVYLIFFLGRHKSAGGTPAIDGAFLVAGYYFPLILVAVGGYVWNGLGVAKVAPDFRVGYLTLAALLQIGLLAPLAVALPISTWLAARRAEEEVELPDAKPLGKP